MRRRRALLLLAVLTAGLVPQVSVAQEEPPGEEATEGDQADDGDADAGTGEESEQAPDDDDRANELGEVLEELSGAEQELASALRKLEEAEAELDAIDRRIGAAAAELNRLEQQVDEAEEALEQARQRVDDAVAAIADAEQRLELAERLETEAVARLEARAAEVYKHGSTLPQHFLMRGVAGADDWHEVAVTMRTFDRVLVDDANLIDDAVTARALADSARERAELARAEAEDAEEAAAAELAELEALRDRQASVVASAQQDRRRQHSIYAALEEDAAVMAALKTKLEEQIRALRTRPAQVSGPPPEGMPAWAGALPGVGHAWAALIAVAAHANGLDGRLMAALVWTESAFNPDAVSPAGAIGLAQLMPGTAAWLGVDPWTPETNLDGGARYLRMQLDRFGSVELALAAYNAGPGAVTAYGGIPPFAETQLYVVRVLERFQHLAG